MEAGSEPVAGCSSFINGHLLSESSSKTQTKADQKPENQQKSGPLKTSSGTRKAGNKTIPKYKSTSSRTLNKNSQTDAKSQRNASVSKLPPRRRQRKNQQLERKNELQESNTVAKPNPTETGKSIISQFHNNRRSARNTECSILVEKQPIERPNEEPVKLQSFSCKKCDNKYETKEQLETHEKSHVGQLVDCGVCGTLLFHRYSLERHFAEAHATQFRILPEVNYGVGQLCPECQNPYGIGKHEKVKYSLCHHLSCLECVNKIDMGCVECALQQIQEEDEARELEEKRVAQQAMENHSAMDLTGAQK